MVDIKQAITLARAFSEDIQASLTPREFQEVLDRNAA